MPSDTVPAARTGLPYQPDLSRRAILVSAPDAAAGFAEHFADFFQRLEIDRQITLIQLLHDSQHVLNEAIAQLEHRSLQNANGDQPLRP